MAVQDIISVLISNVVFLLSRNLTIWERLRAEAASVNLASLTAEDTTKLRLTRHILYECKSYSSSNAAVNI